VFRVYLGDLKAHDWESQQTREREAMKKLKLSRETLSVLNSSDLSAVNGGGIIIITPTLVCPVLTAGCTGGPCVMTGGGTVGSCTSECGPTLTGTSVINPGGG
jgi:hypothetical protein